MRLVRVEPLTPEAFESFGEVVSAERIGGRSANQGTATRFDHAATIANGRPGVPPNLAVFRAQARALPLLVHLVEKHPHSSQLFAPLRVGRYLVCVAPSLPDGAPDLGALRAFLGGPGQAVNYAPGTWHHPFVALDADAELLMLAFEDGSAGDLVEHPFEPPIVVVE